MPRTVACFHNFGGLTGRETPLPIPNREVKPARADGTRRATSRESRSPPINFARARQRRARARFAGNASHFPRVRLGFGLGGAELLAPVRVEGAQALDAF